MTDLIIFSRNRACQLDLLLRSIDKNLDFFDRISVIYTYDIDASSYSEFKIGYDKLRYNTPKVRWILETDFQKNVIDTIESSSEFVCFMVDDDIAYRKPDITVSEMNFVLNNIIKYLYEQGTKSILSLRLGRNITVGDNFTNIPVQQPEFAELLIGEVTKFLIWTNENYHSPFHYPISLDGHIFERDWILSKCRQIEFSNPNFMEGNLQKFGQEIIGIVSPIQSLITSVPVNRVQSIFENKTTEQISASDLNLKWLMGNNIDLDNLIKNPCNCTHSNWEYKI